MKNIERKFKRFVYFQGPEGKNFEAAGAEGVEKDSKESGALWESETGRKKIMKLAEILLKDEGVSEADRSKGDRGDASVSREVDRRTARDKARELLEMMKKNTIKTGAEGVQTTLALRLHGLLQASGVDLSGEEVDGTKFNVKNLGEKEISDLDNPNLDEVIGAKEHSKFGLILEHGFKNNSEKLKISFNEQTGLMAVGYDVEMRGVFSPENWKKLGMNVLTKSQMLEAVGMLKRHFAASGRYSEQFAAIDSITSSKEGVYLGKENFATRMSDEQAKLIYDQLKSIFQSLKSAYNG